jgi:hypothetical protein
MIPLFAFLILWLILVGVYVVLALITMMQMLRFGISSPSAIFFNDFLSHHRNFYPWRNCSLSLYG